MSYLLGIFRQTSETGRAEILMPMNRPKDRSIFKLHIINATEYFLVSLFLYIYIYIYIFIDRLLRLVYFMFNFLCKSAVM
jgi:hypothetical protein